MFSICVFYYLFFLYCVPTLEAGPIECLSSDEHLQCVFPCPTSEVECVNGEIRRSCLNSTELCTMQCVCKPGFYRSYLGECLPEENCGKCGHHEFFSCGPECDSECSTLHEMNRTNCLILNIVCNEKCYCEDGFARNYARECIPVEECPSYPMRCYRANEILDCVLPCPPEKTCRNREIMFNCLDVIQPCRPQCVCKPGFYRNSNGECVTGEQCAKCPGKHEFFSCGSACDTECATLNESCPILNIKCNEKCYCEKGYARDEVRKCIPITECPPKPYILKIKE